MIKTLNTKSKKFKNQLNHCLNSRKKYSASKSMLVKKIVYDVKSKKDKSLIKYEKKFNNLKQLSKKSLSFSKKEIKGK